MGFIKWEGYLESIHAVAPIVDDHCQSIQHFSWEHIFNITPVKKAGIISDNLYMQCPIMGNSIISRRRTFNAFRIDG